LNERKKKMIENDVNALRSSAKIEYVGKFAEAAASAPQAAPTAPTATPAAVPASAGLSSTDISKGMGLK
jgi:hypothetical protein